MINKDVNPLYGDATNDTAEDTVAKQQMIITMMTNLEILQRLSQPVKKIVQSTFVMLGFKILIECHNYIKSTYSYIIIIN